MELLLGITIGIIIGILLAIIFILASIKYPIIEIDEKLKKTNKKAEIIKLDEEIIL